MNTTNSISIINEYSDLLFLYDLVPFTRDALKDILWTHFKNWERVGFNTEVTENVIEMFYRRFTLTSHKKLEKEKEFIQKLGGSNILDTLGVSCESAKKFLPEQSYKYPELVFLLNCGRTDAKVMDTLSFGINLQNLFDKVYLGDTNQYDFPKALEIIENRVAHESNHIFIKQVAFELQERVPLLVDIAFHEGLAPLCETQFYFPWSEDYINNNKVWLTIVKDALNAKTISDKEKVLDALINEPVLCKHDDRVATLVGEAKNDIEKTFEDTLYRLLVERNGPLYYVGYSLWKNILETEGASRVMEVVRRGPKEYSKYILDS